VCVCVCASGAADSKSPPQSSFCLCASRPQQHGLPPLLSHTDLCVPQDHSHTTATGACASRPQPHHSNRCMRLKTTATPQQQVYALLDNCNTIATGACRPQLHPCVPCLNSRPPLPVAGVGPQAGARMQPSCAGAGPSETAGACGRAV